MSPFTKEDRNNITTAIRQAEKHENQRDMNVPPIVAACLAIGVAIAGTRITGISAIDGVF